MSVVPNGVRFGNVVGVFAALAVAACEAGSGSAADPAGVSPGPDGSAEACVALACRACAQGERCAEGGTAIEGTCCAEGDNLLHTEVGAGSEVVDVASDGDFVVACGGFGAAVIDVREPVAETFGSATRRCQNAAFGPVLDGDRRVVYAAHHGDSWVNAPSLETFVIDPTEPSIVSIGIQEGGALYEGLAYVEGHLYVADHADGVRVYRVDAEGLPTLVAQVPDFDNAVEIASEPGLLYVADRVSGLHVMSLADPQSPRRLQTLTLSGTPRDVVAQDGRVYVALGAAGVDVFERGGDGALSAITNVVDTGAVQQVAVGRGLLALASWSHVAVRDAQTLRLLGTERTRPTPEFEQDLGVAIAADRIFAGEWEGVHALEFRPGFVAPDIAVEQEVLDFRAAQPESRVVVVRNRGALDLEVSDVVATDPAFSVDRTAFTVAPGAAASLEVAFAPPGPQSGWIDIISNDPDDDAQPYRLPITASFDPELLNVGDRLGEEFNFLDLEGLGNVDELEGDVLVLAYFALF